MRSHLGSSPRLPPAAHAHEAVTRSRLSTSPFAPLTALFLLVSFASVLDRVASQVCPANACVPCGELSASGFSIPASCQNTCVFQETSTDEPEGAFSSAGVGTVGWHTRRLVKTVGTSASCGGVLNTANHVVTLLPATYTVSVTSTSYSQVISTVRLVKLDASGNYLSTVALGSPSFRGGDGNVTRTSSTLARHFTTLHFTSHTSDFSLSGKTRKE